MSTRQPQVLSLPGEEQREKWRRDGSGQWKREEGPADARGSTYVLEMLLLDSSPFPALAPGGNTTALESTALLRWETLGAEMQRAGRNWMFWTVERTGDHALVGTLALTADGLTLDTSLHAASSFEPSAMSYPIPTGGIALWKELGRYVVVFTRGDVLLHAAVLSTRALNQHAAMELLSLSRAISTFTPTVAWNGIWIWAQATAEFAATMEAAFGIPVVIEAKPPPRLPAQRSHIVPPGVFLKRESQRRQRRAILLTAGVVMLLVACFVAWGGRLTMRERRLASTLDSLRGLEPEIAKVQDAQSRWWALEPAVTRDDYPMEVFREIVSLLPVEGVRFKEFSMNLEKIIISGEATSPMHASKFQSDLKASESLKRYAFTAPQPTILDDNRASFHVEGSNKEGGSNEGE